VDLDGVVGDARADLRREQLRLRRDQPEIAALVLQPGERQTRPRAASISVAMSATMKATPWNVPIGRPNCSRVCAYEIDASSAPWAMPTASAPIEMRRHRGSAGTS